MSRLSVIAMEVGSAAAFAFLASRPKVQFFVSEAVAGLALVPDSRLISEVTDEELLAAETLLCSLTGAREEHEALEKARRFRIPSVQFLDTWGPYHHRAARPIADRIAVIDEHARLEAIHAGIDPDAISIVGQPAWESVDRLAPAPRECVAFLSQPVSRHYGGSLGYDECTALRVIEAVAVNRPDLVKEIIVVPHPAGCRNEGDLRSASLMSALETAGTIVGMFSSAMVDAILCGRNVISVQPYARGADRCALSRTGRIARTMSAEELVRTLECPQPTAAEDLARMLSGSKDRLVDLINAMDRN